MLYCCETCGKKYSTEEEALDCERVHAEEKARKEALAKTREDRVNEIREDYKALSEKCEQYFKDYGKYPRLDSSTIGHLSPIDWIFRL